MTRISIIWDLQEHLLKNDIVTTKVGLKRK